METDLIFHIVSRRKWTELNKGGFFKPEEFDKSVGIECVSSSYLQDHLNKEHFGRKNLFILVIDKGRLTSKMTKEKDGDIIKILDPINLDAILDKIRIDCNEEKKFDLTVKSYV
ncbi:MAG: DUF952 domain-containing protein [Balneolaceae bacterium]